ncbi:MAG TPA: hypothetical protein PLV05_13125 [Verrucomicrobiota bacterium]|nr:hypothetical protein [Verrucomicrobiota bacterium]OQC25775.1 MAG: hypothetical protein BWX68_01250 [Verrucomicrobia bacterium ADurb.Bin063]HRR65711.1 hypothetical protein [Candidatus Paceibacterota bacterium]MBP8015163.1 hypothetical protein [Verrucomicrobiota bacterium]MDI9374074.1 hypothetical protein [Verrucomicrobiota bacterium]
MSPWHDMVTSPPAEGQLVLARRLPGDCPPLAARWDAARARFQCGPERWGLPWQFVAHWRPLAADPAWPRPRAGTSPWQDVYLCPPAPGQSVWLRRGGEDTAAFRAVFDRAGAVFTLPNGWRISWYEVSRWRGG